MPRPDQGELRNQSLGEVNAAIDDVIHGKTRARIVLEP